MRSFFKRFFKGLEFNRPASDGVVNEVRFVRSPQYLNLRDRDIDNNTIVQACVRWAMRNFPEPPLLAWKMDKNGDSHPDVTHRLSQIWRNPNLGVATNNKISYRILAAMIIFSLILDGNAYVYILRGGGGQVIGLQWLFHGRVEPIAFSNNSGELSHYRIDGQTDVLAEDILHIRDGIDSANPLKACSPLKSLMRLALTDNEIAVYSWSILKRPHPSIVLSAKDQVVMDQDQIDDLQRKIDEQTADEKSGGIMFLSSPMNIDKMTITPEEMAIDKLARIPEERITAVLGVPAIVAGLGAGLERATFSNYKEARQAATEDFLVPYWMLVSEQIADQMIGASDSVSLLFDLRRVRALQEDEDAKHKRVAGTFGANLINRAEARMSLGYDPIAGDDALWAWMLRPVGMPSDAQAAKVASTDLRRKVEDRL